MKILIKLLYLGAWILNPISGYGQIPGLSYTQTQTFDNNGSTLVVYPQPKDYYNSPDYTIEVNGHPVYMYQYPGFAGGDINFASFDFKGKATVKVTSYWHIDKAEVHPLSYKIPCKLEGKTITFTIDKPCNLFLKVNGIFELPVYIFANPLNNNAITKPSENVVYYGPGQHQAGDITLKSNQTLYLDGGAIVYGNIQCQNASNVKVTGRGIICGKNYIFGQFNKPAYINFSNSQNILFENVIVLDAPSWTVAFRNCDSVNVDRARILSERLWSTDGINPCGSRNVLIENTFIRSKDDCISVKGLAWEEGSKWHNINNIHVKNCVFWSENNNGVVIGAETRAERFENVRFENIDILKTTNSCGDIAGALTVICLDDTYMSDFLFENIRVEYATTPIINIFYTDLMFGTIPGSRKPEGGTLKNITFRNIQVEGGIYRRSFIKGMDPKRLVENVTIENLTLGGKKTLKAEEARIEINNFVRNITFK